MRNLAPDVLTGEGCFPAARPDISGWTPPRLLSLGTAMTSRTPMFAKPGVTGAASPALVRPGLLQRCGGRKCPDGGCQREAGHVPPVVHEVLRSPGQPLPASARDVMEAHFGHDFSRVRVHADGQAAEAAQAVGSDAFTLGNHVVFGASRWAPQTAARSPLLAHELTHVIQQRSALGTATGELELGEHDDPAEREATAAAAGFGRPGPPHAGPVPHLRVVRQETGQDDRPLAAPVLTPTDSRVSKILERLAGATGGQGAKAGGEVIDPACQAPVAESPPWMPHIRQRSPIDLGKGTRREPKLKAPDGPGGAKCRGACGEDCPNTCKSVGTYSEQYEVGGCGYLIEFPNAFLCGTNAGCRSHDACFDAAVASGETDIGGPRHVQCTMQAGERYGPKTLSWARGGGPYDDWWYFVDDPVVRKSWRLKEPVGPAFRRPP